MSTQRSHDELVGTHFVFFLRITFSKHVGDRLVRVSVLIIVRRPQLNVLTFQVRLSNGTQVILVGTAHISLQSVLDVQVGLMME